MKKFLKKVWILSQNNSSLRVFISLVYNLLNKNKKKIKGKDNTVDYNEAFLKGITIKICGSNNKIIFQKNARLINSRITVLGNGHKIIIGESCIIKNSGFVLEDNNCGIFVGEHTTIEGAELASVEDYSKITIGKDCMFSADIEIRTSDSHSIINANDNKRINMAKDIMIGNHVWVGLKSTILKGVSIGDNSIIGIGSIVTESVPNNSIAVGIPAKVTKYEITWMRERI